MHKLHVYFVRHARSLRQKSVGACSRMGAPEPNLGPRRAGMRSQRPACERVSQTTASANLVFVWATRKFLSRALVLHTAGEDGVQEPSEEGEVWTLRGRCQGFMRH